MKAGKHTKNPLASTSEAILWRARRTGLLTCRYKPTLRVFPPG